MISITFNLCIEKTILHATQDCICTRLLEAHWCVIDENKKRLKDDGSYSRVSRLEEMAW